MLQKAGSSVEELHVSHGSFLLCLFPNKLRYRPLFLPENTASEVEVASPSQREGDESRTRLVIRL